MNRPIRNVAIAVMVLFLALMINATYLQYLQADNLTSLSKHPDNNRVKDAAFSEPRGKILVGNRAIALSRKSDDRYDFLRVYPDGAEYAHISGYFARNLNLGGIESSQNDVLTGDAPNLFVNRVIDLLGNETPQGGNVSLTLNAKAQKAAYDGLRALGTQVRGAVVAIEPATGRVLAMVSSPSFSPNRLATHAHNFTSAGHYYQKLIDDPLSPLNNRAIEERLPPGSTFKLVTAAAALSSGKYTPSTMVDGGASLDLPLTSKNLVNESRGGCGGAKITLTRALDVSCNVAFGSVGLKLGPDALIKQAEKFGWGQAPFKDLDDPLTRMAVSVMQARDKDGNPVPIDKPQTAFTAIGQSNVAATPMQMAMVASAIANNGRLMKPYLVDEIRSADLDVIKTTKPEALNPEAVSPSVARQLTQMMVSVVDNGTGVNAQIPGIKVAGKTGTAQSAPSRPPYAWFVSFAPADDARIAVAVLIQDAGVDRNAISGNGLAAPIAKRVIEAVLNP
ncbi:peptidoglycan D,D-transpeptidase FtsI family protein [Nocardioides marmorisolisilvae]|uniref:Penicillin-binding protein 2 n=1 Tax=Nocardioides marmorisolisilvae TaxID=1542737 RepID=A0A3N0DJC9_9ACTN|nr:penicillin-binding transpeptidase domain-containing protein [Nocardioides marmorisolisilvae]RNL75343.1 penicillin-binding protein 2 [Nocardioides marmorisolisilvae]